MMPALVTPSGAISTTRPPAGVTMCPAFVIAFASGVGPKRSLPVRKSASMMLSVDATRPAVSMWAPAPNTMPFGLIRKTRPLELSVPRIAEASPLTTRLSTALAAFCWMNFVVSPAPIEKPCQLMMLPGVFVTVRTLPWLLNVAWPWVTTGPTGLAQARAGAKQHATAVATA
jgi:hypothetical protein